MIPHKEPGSYVSVCLLNLLPNWPGGVENNKLKYTGNIQSLFQLLSSLKTMKYTEIHVYFCELMHVFCERWLLKYSFYRDPGLIFFSFSHFGGLNLGLFSCFTQIKCFWTGATTESLHCKWKKSVLKLPAFICVTMCEHWIPVVSASVHACIYNIFSLCASKSFSTCSLTSLPSRQGDMGIEPSASFPPLDRSPSSQ